MKDYSNDLKNQHIDKKGIYTVRFISTDCLFCKEKREHVLYPARLYNNSFTDYTFSARRSRKREHYRIVKCSTCQLVRSNPVVSEDMIDSLYAHSKFIFSDEAPYVASTYAILLKRLMNKYNIKLNSLLELGCSSGFFLNEALSIGFNDVVGFEPSRDCYQRAEDRIKGRIINDIYKPELLKDKKFDLVCIFHLIDHLYNPQAVISSLTQALNVPHGYLLIICHDVESWSVKLLGGQNPMFDIEHIYLFSKKTIAMLLEGAGFRVLEVESLPNTYPFGYWLRMLPAGNKIVSVLPKCMQNIPIKIKAGNLYIFCKKG
ncbi:MAG: class I SAM-dependent methyltransferase [Candidatus Omnitrophota bacterium]